MWFTETPWPPIAICGVVAVLFLARWQNSGRAAPLLGAVGMILLSAGIFVLEQWIVTDAEQIEQSVYELVQAFENNELACVDYVSKTTPILRGMMVAAVEFVDVRDTRVTDLSVTLRAENSRATSHFRANATVSFRGADLGHQASRWELDWQREEDAWRIIEIRRLNPVTGDEMSIPVGGR